ncbi:hypothetical protein VSR01_03875 [Actinacidiphila sp. DG2A-62]|uniref:hypothetical protein n=1 Tax=Actinacidiphila sp. DG2A-62 TaxID=3108821 RepID=UPI002DBC6B25|nr:hypothetical protein [Actinacidiphila sp. DG2A-62]MEC3992733.1 hypothetical protein [Actinacidiphila sp. DG2A-62]
MTLRSARRALAAAAAAVACSAALAVNAPVAQASTTASCAEGYTTSPFRGILDGKLWVSSGCAFTDTGAPYVITVAKLNVTATFVNPPLHYYFVNAVATCPTVTVDEGWLLGSQCTYAT